MNGVLAIPLVDVARDPSAPDALTDAARARSFWCGPENDWLPIVLEFCAEAEVRRYPLIVVRGASGTGKTALARHLAAQWSERCGPEAVLLREAVDFARELQDAIERRSAESWRRSTRRVKLLVLENIEQLADKPPLEQELCYALDALADAGAQVICTVRAQARCEQQLLPALRSRLSAGLVVNLRPPGLEARRQMLSTYCAERGVRIQPTALERLAAEFLGAADELRGAVHQLEAEAALARRAIGVDHVRRLLADRSARRAPTIRGIAVRAARHYGLKLGDLRSASRQRNVVLARDVAMYLARELGRKSLAQIGHYFGERDHTTVLHGCRKTAERLPSDPALRQSVRELSDLLGCSGESLWEGM